MQTRGPLAMISLQDKVKGLVEKVRRGEPLEVLKESPEFLSLSQMEKVTLLQSLCTNPAMSQLEKAQKVARERITHLYNRLHQQQSHSLQAVPLGCRFYFEVKAMMYVAGDTSNPLQGNIFAVEKDAIAYIHRIVDYLHLYSGGSKLTATVVKELLPQTTKGYVRWEKLKARADKPQRFQATEGKTEDTDMDKDEDDAGSGKGLDEGDWSDDSDVDSSDEQLEAAGPGKRAYEPSIEIDALRFQTRLAFYAERTKHMPLPVYNGFVKLRQVSAVNSAPQRPRGKSARTEFQELLRIADCPNQVLTLLAFLMSDRVATIVERANRIHHEGVLTDPMEPLPLNAYTWAITATPPTLPDMKSLPMKRQRV